MLHILLVNIAILANESVRKLKPSTVNLSWVLYMRISALMTLLCSLVNLLKYVTGFAKRVLYTQL